MYRIVTTQVIYQQKQVLIIHPQFTPLSVTMVWYHSLHFLWHFLCVHLVASILAVVFGRDMSKHFFIGSSVKFSQRLSSNAGQKWNIFSGFLSTGFLHNMYKHGIWFWDFFCFSFECVEYFSKCPFLLFCNRLTTTLLQMITPLPIVRLYYS